jgi:hypothetical protein
VLTQFLHGTKSCLRGCRSLLFGVSLLGCATIPAQESAKQAVIPLPPMGWSSWNSFSNTIDSEIVVAQANAMVSSGMKASGYEYINIDEGWWQGQRDQQGNILVDPKAWPAIAPGEHAGDMANIARYIHSLGLKAGIYTDAGTNGCGTYDPDLGPGFPYTGSEGHFEQDFTQFARWGFDYLKVDYCGASEENVDPAHQYFEIVRALARAETATGHTMFLSICAGKSSPWMWAPNIGGITADIWRTDSDIVGPVVAGTRNAYMNLTCTKNCPRGASFQRVLRNFDTNVHPEAQHTGFYNDPDMMVLGMPGLTEAENRVHMSLWAMSGAPLIVGADLGKLSSASQKILRNEAVIRVDQDALGLQAVKVAEPRAGLEVWSKRLATPGERAVLLLNRTGEASPISVEWSELGLLGSVEASAKDIWNDKEISHAAKPISAVVPADDAVMLVAKGEEREIVRYQPDAAASPSERNVLTDCTNGKEFRFERLPSGTKVEAIQIVYVNSDSVAHAGELRVNGQNATRIVFPPGDGKANEVVWVQAVLDRVQTTNTLTITTDCGTSTQIESIGLE